MNFPSVEDRYQIISQIGRGGTGRVYKALDTQIGREVAIKFLNAIFLNDAVLLQRFKREVEALASTRHTAIVPLYNYGGFVSPSQTNPPYIVMRLMDQSLDDILVPSKSMNFAAALHVIGRLAAVLDFVHQRGLIHRDIKPKNIFLDHQRYSYLGDFGIARKALGETLVDNAIIGTPHYMSPEQIRTLPLDSRSDIYSLGCVLYQLLSGFKPFHTEEAGPAVFQAHHYADRPSVDARQIGLPTDINEILRKVMAVEREERYGTARELIIDLKRLSSIPLPSISYPPPAFYSDTAVFKKESAHLGPALKPIEIESAADKDIETEDISKNRTLKSAGYLGLAIAALAFLLLLWRGDRSTLSSLPDPTNDFSTASAIITVTPSPSIEITQEITQEIAETDIPPQPLSTSIGTPESANTAIFVCRSVTDPPILINFVKASDFAVMERDEEISSVSFGTASLCALEETVIKSNRDLLDFRYAGNRYVMGKFAQLSISENRVEFKDGDFLVEAPQSSKQLFLKNIQLSVEEGALGIRISEQANLLQIDCLATRCLISSSGQFFFDLTDGEGILSRLDLLNSETSIRSAESGSYIDPAIPDLLADSDSDATRAPANIAASTLTPTVGFGSNLPPLGSISYTCLFKRVDQVCLLDVESGRTAQLTNDSAPSSYGAPGFLGAQITFSSRRDGQWRLYTTDYFGDNQQLLAGRKINTFAPEVSPDGMKLVYTITSANLTDGQESSHIWVYDFETKLNEQITEGEHKDQYPSWSADGSKILFASDRTGEKRHYLIQPDGGQLTEIQAEIKNIGGRSDLSPDGKWLAFYAAPAGDSHIYLISLEDGGLRQLTDTGNNLSPSFSPDGQWVVFSSLRNREKDSELYIIRIDGSNLTKMTENDINDWQPRWGP